MSKSKNLFVWLLMMIVIVIVAVGTWQWSTISSKLENIIQKVEVDFVGLDFFGKQSRLLISELQVTKLAAENRINQLAASDVIPEHTGNNDSQLIIITSPSDDLRALQNVIVAINQAVQSRLQQLEPQNNSSVTVIETNSNLSNLSASIDSLPLLKNSELTKIECNYISAQLSADNVWSELANEIWQDLSALVTIQKANNMGSKLLSPSQVYFLHEGLRLNFILMRLSLFSHDDSSFNADLEATEAWINQNYDKKSEAVISLLQALDQLRNKEDQ